MIRSPMLRELANGCWAQDEEIYGAWRSMKQGEFEAINQELWQEFDAMLGSADKLSAQQAQLFPSRYRTVCQHSAVAKSRGYASGLQNRLNSLVQAGYQALYAGQSTSRGGLANFILYVFPAVLRANARFVWVAVAMFTLPAIIMLVACLINEELIYSLVDPTTVRGFESMYDPEVRKLGRERQADSDLFMFGYYIYNNIGVSFRCFATGIFGGLGSLFFVAFNGLLLGGVAGHLTSLGFSQTFYPFVIGHGALELTAIVFSGAAGLKLGYAVVAPGAHSRLAALQIAATDAIKIVYGSSLMLLVAAFIEAFWSSSASLPIWLKLTVGAGLWLVVIYYCCFFGRFRQAQYSGSN